MMERTDHDAMPHFPQWHVMLADEGGLLAWLGGPFATQRQATALIDKLGPMSTLGEGRWMEAVGARTHEEALALLPSQDPEPDDELVGDPTYLDPWALDADELLDAMRDFCGYNDMDEFGDFRAPLSEREKLWWQDACVASDCFAEDNSTR